MACGVIREVISLLVWPAIVLAVIVEANHEQIALRSKDVTIRKTNGT
jgi:hypothetical protein